MTGFPRACSSCGGILLGRRTRFCASCAPPRRSFSDPRYGSPQWKRTVLAIKRRDGWRCQLRGNRARVGQDVVMGLSPGSFGLSPVRPPSLRRGPYLLGQLTYCPDSSKPPTIRVAHPLGELTTSRRPAFGPVGSCVLRDAKPQLSGDR